MRPLPDPVQDQTLSISARDGDTASICGCILASAAGHLTERWWSGSAAWRRPFGGDSRQAWRCPRSRHFDLAIRHLWYPTFGRPVFRHVVSPTKGLDLARSVARDRRISDEYSRIYCRAITARRAWTLSPQPGGPGAAEHRHPCDSEMRELRFHSRVLCDTRRKATRRVRCLRIGSL